MIKAIESGSVYYCHLLYNGLVSMSRVITDCWFLGDIQIERIGALQPSCPFKYKDEGGRRLTRQRLDFVDALDTMLPPPASEPLLPTSISWSSPMAGLPTSVGPMPPSAPPKIMCSLNLARITGQAHTEEAYSPLWWMWRMRPCCEIGSSRNNAILLQRVHGGNSIRRRSKCS